MTTNAVLAQPWQPARKMQFRFALIFFVLFIICNPNGAAPMLEPFYDYYIQPVHWLIVWLGTHVLHLVKPISQFTNGSGDTAYDWLVLVFIIVISALGSVMWSVINRRPVSYDRLYYWLLVILRFYVGISMVSYGLYKVFKLQFPSPGPDRLSQPYGNSSPMGLAWTFMGYSRGYNYFTGLAELSCGILLFFRKTTLLGAVIAFTVIANIVAINFVSTCR